MTTLASSNEPTSLSFSGLFRIKGKNDLPALSAFAICFIVWAYLFIVTEPVIVFDAEVYHNRGEMIYQQGLWEFFRTGPHIEPLFPCIIALSKTLGAYFKVSFLFFIKFFGLLSLFLTTVLARRLMIWMKFHPIAIAIGILLIGLSPGLLISSLRIWGEYASYPFVMLAMLLAIRITIFLNNGTPEANWKEILGHAVPFAVTMLLFTSVKAVAEGVFLLLLIFWGIYAIIRLGANTALTSRKIWHFFFMTIALYGGMMNLYKTCNWLGNKNFTSTSRAEYFYGHVSGATAKLDVTKVMAIPAGFQYFVPCAQLVSEEACNYWSFGAADQRTKAYQEKLQSAGYTGEKAVAKLKHDIIAAIAGNPLQFILITFIKFQGVFVWNSTATGFVAYPQWLERILYDHTVVMAVHHISMTVNALCFYCVLAWLFRQRKELVPKDTTTIDVELLALLILMIVVCGFGGIYAIFSLTDRYVYPIASLLIIMIVSCLNRFLPKPRTEAT